MLGFFRKYQKFFFVVVTFFIVLSFSFFGTFSTLLNRKEELPDREIGQLIDGSVLKEQKVHKLVRLLSHGVEEGGQMNLLNDSMIHKDFILSGLGETLATTYFAKFKEELELRWKRAKNYAPYVHPFASTLSARSVWSTFSPKIPLLLDQLRVASEELTVNEVPLLFKLYQAQAEFPPQYLQQILYYQQLQNEGIPPDRGLPHANFALFGFQSIEDWFGPTFVEEIVTFILNGACYAKEEGYVVKREEAKVDLFSNVFHTLQRHNEKKEVSGEEAQKFYSRQLFNLGIEEKEAIDLWREILLFRRIFNEVGEGVFVDTLSFQQFKSFAKPGQQICRYALPKALQLHNFRELLKFQRYLEIVSNEEIKGLALPTHFREAETIMDAYPELVYKAFVVEIATVNKLEAAARISIKQTWEWERDAENFSALQKAFPALAKTDPKSVSDRVEALEGLDELTRFKVDQFARSSYIDSHPELIDELLAQAKGERQTLKVSLRARDNPFSGSQFLGMLEIEDKKLQRYTIDGETFHSIQVIEKTPGWKVFPFEDVNKNQIMDRLLDELLVEAYAGMELEEPFEEVKESVGAKVYADLLKKLAKEGEVKELEDYPKYRFTSHLKEMRHLAIENSEKFKEMQKGPWALEEKKELVTLAGKELGLNAFSEIEKEGFYQLLEKKECMISSQDAEVAKSYLKKEAQKELMKKILERV